MSAYLKMKQHLEQHVYKRGMYKGEAPVESRGKNHFRIVEGKSPDVMAVRFHNTDIITVYPDGDFKLNTNGWAGSVTTKMAINDAAWKFLGFGVNIHNKTVFSHKQEVVTVKGKVYVYYDGMQFSAEGELISHPKPFSMRRIDREAVKQLALDVKASGFKDMFPVLHSVCTPEDARAWMRRSSLQVITQPNAVLQWQIVIAKQKYTGLGFSLALGFPSNLERDMKTTWTSLMKDAKVDMYNIIASDVTVL